MEDWHNLSHAGLLWERPRADCVTVGLSFQKSRSKLTGVIYREKAMRRTVFEIMASKVKHWRPKKTTFSAPLAGPPGRLPPICEMQWLGQTSIPVQNVSQICSADSKKMRPEQRDRQTANLISSLPWWDNKRFEGCHRVTVLYSVV